MHYAGEVPTAGAAMIANQYGVSSDDRKATVRNIAERGLVRNDIPPCLLFGIVRCAETCLACLLMAADPAEIERARTLFVVADTYPKVSAKHLDAYLDELEHRFNNRNNEFLFRDTLLKLVKAEKLPYSELTKAA